MTICNSFRGFIKEKGLILVTSIPINYKPKRTGRPKMEKLGTLSACRFVIWVDYDSILLQNGNFLFCRFLCFKLGAREKHPR
jgi:hypothetical protein